MAQTDKIFSENMNIISKLFVLILLLSLFVFGLLGLSLFATYQWRNTFVPTANWESVKGNEVSQRQSAKNKAEQESSQSQAQNFIYVLFFIVILILVLIAYIIIFFSKAKNGTKHLISAILNSGSEVTKMSEVLLNHESSLSVSIKKTSDHFSHLQLALTDVSQLSDKKIESINKALETNQTSSKVTMNGIEDISHLVDFIKKIRASSVKILDVSKVIDGIAYQTNLLALNAAVEASRAGEQGKGFAVVAEAVQVLAQKAAAATKEINSATKEAVISVEKGALTSDKISNVFQNILGSVKKTENLIYQLNTDSNLQNNSTAELSRTLVEIEKEIKTEFIIAKKVAETNIVLNQNSKDLQASTSDFAKLLFQSL